MSFVGGFGKSSAFSAGKNTQIHSVSKNKKGGVIRGDATDSLLTTLRGGPEPW
jgi:hypothetical protein